MRLDTEMERVAIILSIPRIAFVLADSADCAPQPISVDIGNVTLSNAKTAWGVELAVGSPPQKFAFMPQWPMNNTMLYGTEGHCALRGEQSWSDAGCITYRGGAYDSQASTSESDAPAGSYPVDIRHQWPEYPDRDYVADTLTLNDNTTLLDFPLAVAQNSWGEEGYLAQMVLGLGSNSTTLNVLKNSGRIASRTWSFFYGLVGGQTRMNGHLIFGGYDASKVSGDSSEHSFSLPKSSCPTQLVVTVTGMALSFPNGTRTSIFGPSDSSALAVCILPTLPTALRIPLDPYFENFMKATNADVYSMNRTMGLYYYNMRYPAHILPYDGDLVISLDTGLSVTLPNELLVVPHTYIDQETGEIIAEDGNEPDLLIDSSQGINANDMAMFGSIFLSAAYLTVNIDAGKFKLWSVSTIGNGSQDLRAVDAENEDITTICKAEGNPSVESNSTETAPTDFDIPRGSADQQDGLDTGEIVGITVGVVVAATTAVGAFVLYRFRKKRKSVYMAAELEASSGSASNYHLPGGRDPRQPAPGAFGRQCEAFELQDPQCAGPRPELHEDSVYKYEMPDTGPPIRYELAS